MSAILKYGSFALASHIKLACGFYISILTMSSNGEDHLQEPLLEQHHGDRQEGTDPHPQL